MINFCCTNIHFDGQYNFAKRASLIGNIFNLTWFQKYDRKLITNTSTYYYDSIIIYLTQYKFI